MNDLLGKMIIARDGERFIVFTIMIMAITSVITTKVKRKRKFRRKW